MVHLDCVLVRSSIRLRRGSPPVDSLLLASNSGMAFAAARCLRLAGFRFRLISPPRYWAVSQMGGCVGHTPLEAGALDDGESLLSELDRLLTEHPEAVIVPAGLATTLFLSRHAGRFRSQNVFPLSPESLLAELHDKWRFADLVQRLGMYHPATSLISDPREAQIAASDFPAILKPLNGEGSAGIHFVPSPEALARAVAAADPKDFPLLVQEYIPGDDMGANLVAQNGRLVACRVQVCLQGGLLRYGDRPDAVEIAQALVESSGAHGVFDLDFRRDSRDDRLAVIECNPRIYATSHKSAYAGMNPVELGIRIARGETIEPDLSANAEVLPTQTALLAIARGKGRSLDPASQLAAHAEVTNPVSSLLRAAEWRFPGLMAPKQWPH